MESHGSLSFHVTTPKGELLGVWRREEILRRVGEGELATTALCKCEGMDEGQPIARVFAGALRRLTAEVQGGETVPLPDPEPRETPSGPGLLPPAATRVSPPRVSPSGWRPALLLLGGSVLVWLTSIILQTWLRPARRVNTRLSYSEAPPSPAVRPGSAPRIRTDEEIDLVMELAGDSGKGWKADRNSVRALLETMDQVKARTGKQAPGLFGLPPPKPKPMPENASPEVRSLYEAAERGEAAAQYALSTALWQGKVGPRDYGEAEKWLRLAAMQGHVEAQFWMGIFLDRGFSGIANGTESMSWFQMAGAQGHVGAMKRLASGYAFGRTGRINAVEAFNWYLKAAELGDPYAQSSVAECYLRGEGVEKTEGAGEVWMRKAAAGGDAYGQRKYGLILLNAPDSTEASLAEGKGWLEKAAAQKDSAAMMQLGLLYAKGQGIRRDGDKALLHLRRAAVHGNLDAVYLLGVLYTGETCVPKDVTEGLAWWTLGAEMGDPVAARDLAAEMAKLSSAQISAVKARAKTLQTALDADRIAAKSEVAVPSVSSAQGSEVALMEAESQPSVVREKVVLEGICSFLLPASLEIPAQMEKMLRDVHGNSPAFDPRHSFAAFPKGVNHAAPEAVSKFCRLVVEMEVGPPGRFPQLGTETPYTPHEVELLDSELKREFSRGPLEVLSWEPAVLRTIRGRSAVCLRFRQRLPDGTPAVVQQFRIPNNDRLHLITFIYRQSETTEWQPALEEVLETFDFEKR